MKVSKKDLQEAKVVLNSLLSKCEKAQLKLVKDTSSHTLLKNRIKALKVALDLIHKSI